MTESEIAASRKGSTAFSDVPGSRKTYPALKLHAVSAKVRSGPPVDDDADYDLPILAGLVPFSMQPGAIIPDPRLIKGVDMPKHVTGFRIG